MVGGEYSVYISNAIELENEVETEDVWLCEVATGVWQPCITKNRANGNIMRYLIDKALCKL